MLLRRLHLVPGDVELLPGRSLEVTESSELQMGGLRALEEAWTIPSMLRHFSVKFGRFLCFRKFIWRLKGGECREGKFETRG